METITDELKSLTTLIQEKVNILFEECNGEPEPGSDLDQLGLKNGEKIIDDFISYGEAGVAFDHLSYMINDLELELNSSERQIFKRLSAIYK